MSIQVVNPYWFGGGASEAITGGGYAPDKDEFYTYNMTTDAYTAITVFPTTVYNSGGFGNSTGFLCFGGYTPSTTTSSYEWDGLAWSISSQTQRKPVELPKPPLL
jgi:hypothetical protein